MRLLVVSQYFWPETFRVNELVSELVQRGHQVTVLTGVPNYPQGRVFDEYARAPADHARFAGADVLRVPLRARGQGNAALLRNYWSFVFWATLLGPWLLRGRRFDAIFMFETSPITSALPALLLRRIKRAPLLLWVLDLWPDTLSAVGVVKSPRALNAVGALVSFIYRRCDLILAQSRAFFPAIQRWAGADAALRYFPQWAEGTFDAELAGAVLAAEVAPYQGRFNVMFAGNIGQAQDFPAILAAADRLRGRDDIRWLIVGDGRAMSAVRDEIAARGLGDRVVLLGRHALDRMPSFFRGADALLVSLKADPLFAMTIPGKVQAYLATGVPLLAMLDGEGRRIVEEAGAGLTCAAGDAVALAANVERLAAMAPAERLEMSRRGRAYCRDQFDRGVLIGRLEGWLREAAAPAAAARR